MEATALMPRHASKSFLLFCVIGGIAYVMDVAVFTTLHLVMNLYVARAFSFLCAASFTWWMNRQITFTASTQLTFHEYIRYLRLMLYGAALNYGTFVLVTRYVPLAKTYPALGIAAGSLAGLLINYLMARRLIEGTPRQHRETLP